MRGVKKGEGRKPYLLEGGKKQNISTEEGRVICINHH